MNILYCCSRCQATAKPGTGSRQDGINAVPPLPERWASRVLPANMREFPGRNDGGGRWFEAEMTLCPSCDDALHDWLHVPAAKR